MLALLTVVPITSLVVALAQQANQEPPPGMVWTNNEEGDYE